MGNNYQSNNHNKTGSVEDKGNSRRAFFKKLGLIGATAAAGGAAMYSGFKYEESKPNRDFVKVLTADNRLLRFRGIRSRILRSMPHD